MIALLSCQCEIYTVSRSLSHSKNSGIFSIDCLCSIKVSGKIVLSAVQTNNASQRTENVVSEDEDSESVGSSSEMVCYRYNQ